MNRIPRLVHLAALALAVPGSLLARPQEAPPADDPEPRGLRLREEGALDGLTLIAPLNSHEVHLVDLAGEVRHTWKTRHAPSGTYVLDDGHLLRCARKEDNPRFHGGGIGGLVQEFDWDGELVWEYELAGADRTQHHDLEPLPNGNVLLIAWEHHSREEALARGRDERFAHEEGLWPDVVLEVKPTRPRGGEVVWTWRAWDHLVQDRDPDKPGFGRPSDHPGRIDINADHRFLRGEETPEERRKRLELLEEMRRLGYAGDAPADAPEPDARAARIGADWLHTNSIAYLPEHDLIALSVPRLCELWVIDHSTTTEQAASAKGGRFGRGGELLWRWGNPRNYGHGGEADQRLFYQHDATWQPGASPGGIALLVYNNGRGRPGKEHSTVELLELPFDPERGFLREPGAPFGPAQPSWTYADPERFYSAFISGAQALPNGNVLICEGAKGRVFEVTRAGEIVWDYWSPLGGEIEPGRQGGNAPPKALFRATRIPADSPALRGRF